MFDGKEYSHVPAPHDYYGNTMSVFKDKKNYNKCTFGLSYEHVRPRVEIENKKIHTQIQFEKVSPMAYAPTIKTVKKVNPKYTCGVKLPAMDDFIKR